MVVKYTGRVLFIFIIFIFVFVFYTPELISTHNSSKGADWLEEVPFQQVYFDIFTFGGYFPQNSKNFAASREIPCKEKMSNNFQTVQDRRNMSFKH